MLITGIILIILSLAIRYWLSRRNFYRKNAFGVQEFNSHGRMIWTRYFEGFVLFIVYFLFIVGAVFILLTYGNKVFDNRINNRMERNSQEHR